MPAATHRTQQITECRNKDGFPYENNGSSVRTYIFPFLSYFIFTQAKNVYNFKKIKNLTSVNYADPKTA